MKLLLSICIPTNGRLGVLKQTLDSIYLNCTASFDEFEVVISDNSENNELENLLENYFGIPNIRYSKCNSIGFLNSINALKLGNGEFLKLHNNYSMFSPKGLTSLIDFLKKNRIIKPYIFFKNSGNECISTFKTFDNFCSKVSYWNSWSTGFSIWKEDFDRFKNIEPDKMFPHLTYFLESHSKQLYIINEFRYFNNQEVLSKGGYNLFRTFSVRYIDLLENAYLNNHISKNTFLNIKNDLLFDFLSTWYFKTKLLNNQYTFDLSDIRKNIQVHYGLFGYILMLFTAHKLFFKALLNKGFLLLKFDEN